MSGEAGIAPRAILRGIGGSLGVLGILGWVLHVPWLATWGGAAVMVPNTGVCLIICALAHASRSRIAVAISEGALLMVTVIAGLVLLHIDTPLDGFAHNPSARMSLATALAVVGLVFSHLKLFGMGPALMVIGLSLTPVLSWLGWVDSFMAWPTGTALCCLGAAQVRGEGPCRPSLTEK